MSQGITLSRRSSRSGQGNRKGTGRIKEIIKEGMFNVNQFHNWITGFKNDETTQPTGYIRPDEVMKLSHQK